MMTDKSATVMLAPNLLRAALLHAAKHDVRYYLCGVCVDLARGCLVAADGHRMFIGRIPDACYQPAARGDATQGFIIPRDSLELALKAHKAAGKRGGTDPELTVMLGADGARLSLGASVTCVAVDGRFPDWTRLAPTKFSGELAGLNPDYVADARDALQLVGNIGSKFTIPSVAYNGDGAAIVTMPGVADAFVIVMPGRHAMAPADEVLATIAHVTRSEPVAADAVA